MSNISDHLKVAAVFAESVRRELRHLPTEAVADLTDGLESDIASSYSMGSNSLTQLSTQPIFYEEPDSASKSSQLQGVHWSVKITTVFMRRLQKLKLSQQALLQRGGWRELGCSRRCLDGC